MQRTKTKNPVKQYRPACPCLTAYFFLDGKVFERARLCPVSEDYEGMPTFEAKKKNLGENAGYRTAQVELRGPGNKIVKRLELGRVFSGNGWQSNFYLSLDEGGFIGFARTTIDEGMLHGTVRLSCKNGPAA